MATTNPWKDADDPPSPNVGEVELLLADGRVVRATLEWDSIGPDFMVITGVTLTDGSTMDFSDAKSWRLMETRTIHDPFTGQDVQVSDRLVDRLRGKYASGPDLPNGRPEFGWRQFEAPPIQHEAANRIEELELHVAVLENAARIVTSFDWSDNAEHAVRTMDALRDLVRR